MPTLQAPGFGWMRCLSWLSSSHRLRRFPRWRVRTLFWGKVSTNRGLKSSGPVPFIFFNSLTSSVVGIPYELKILPFKPDPLKPWLRRTPSSAWSFLLDGQCWQRHSSGQARGPSASISSTKRNASRVAMWWISQQMKGWGFQDVIIFLNQMMILCRYVVVWNIIDIYLSGEYISTCLKPPKKNRWCSSRPNQINNLLRLALVALLHANPLGFLCHLGLKCSSWTITNAGTSARTACSSVGYTDYPSVLDANLMAGRILRTNSQPIYFELGGPRKHIVILFLVQKGLKLSYLIALLSLLRWWLNSYTVGPTTYTEAVKMLMSLCFIVIQKSFVGLSALGMGHKTDGVKPGSLSAIGMWIHWK